MTSMMWCTTTLETAHLRWCHLDKQFQCRLSSYQFLAQFCFKPHDLIACRSRARLRTQLSKIFKFFNNLEANSAQTQWDSDTLNIHLQSQRTSIQNFLRGNANYTLVSHISHMDLLSGIAPLLEPHIWKQCTLGYLEAMYIGICVSRNLQSASLASRFEQPCN